MFSFDVTRIGFFLNLISCEIRGIENWRIFTTVLYNLCIYQIVYKLNHCNEFGVLQISTPYVV